MKSSTLLLGFLDVVRGWYAYHSKEHIRPVYSVTTHPNLFGFLFLGSGEHYVGTVHAKCPYRVPPAQIAVGVGVLYGVAPWVGVVAHASLSYTVLIGCR